MGNKNSDTVQFRDAAVAQVVRNRNAVEDSLSAMFGGTFEVVVRDRKGRVKFRNKFHNTVMNNGRNRILDIVFGSTAKDTWYMGLISSSSYSAIAAADTLASHSGWTEFTAYTGNRQAWVTGSASSQAITGSALTFTINGGGGTAKGLFLCNAASGTTGVLMSAGLFSNGDAASLVSGDTVAVTYTFNG